MVDINEHDRFVVIRRRRVVPAPFMESLDIYEFALADADLATAPICHVRQSVSRLTERIGFYADEARTVALMYLNPRPRFDPWARYELSDPYMEPIGEIQKVFMARRRCYYVLYGGDGNEVARVDAHVPGAVGRRRAGRVAVLAAAGALGLPFIGAAGVVAAATVAATSAIRQMQERVDPIDVASELHIVRGDEILGAFVRHSLAGTVGPGTSTIPLPWRSAGSVYEIDMSADGSKTVDRRLVLAVPVALDALRGVFAESALR